MAYTSGYLIVFGAVMVASSSWRALPDWWPRPGRIVMLFGGRHGPRQRRRHPGVPALPPRRASSDWSARLNRSSEFSATLTGYLAAAGRSISHLERSVLERTRSTASFRASWSSPWRRSQSTVRLVRPRRRELASATETSARIADAPPHRHARRDCRDRRGAVARHAHAGLRLAVSRLSADAGPARRGPVWQSVPARHGGARRVRPRGFAQPAARALGGYRSASGSSTLANHRVAARAAALHALRRHSGRSTRCWRRSPAASCSSRCPSTRRKASSRTAATS